jgi:hypothetical protein
MSGKGEGPHSAGEQHFTRDEVMSYVDRLMRDGERELKFKVHQHRIVAIDVTTRHSKRRRPDEKR